MGRSVKNISTKRERESEREKERERKREKEREKKNFSLGKLKKTRFMGAVSHEMALFLPARCRCKKGEEKGRKS